MSIKSLKRFEGWLLIDHSASPGIPAHVARRMGLNPEDVAGGRRVEKATITCKHCGGAWIKNPRRTRPRNYCRPCEHYICDACAYLASLPGYVHRCKEALMDAALSSVKRSEPIGPFSPKSISIIVP